MRVSRIVLASSLIFIASSALGQEEARFTGKTTVLVVEVPVNVDALGEPVRGLTAESFEVIDRGEPRPLVSFEVIDLEAQETSGTAQPVPQVARRHFLLLFDLSFTRTSRLVRSLRAGRQLLGADLHPTDRVAVGVYGLSGGARLLLSFTSDLGQVNQVLDVLEGLVDRDANAAQALRGRPRGDDPLRLVASDVSAVAAEIGRAAGPEITIAFQALTENVMQGIGGRAPDLQAGALVDLDEKVLSKELRERRRGEALALSISLGELARNTRGVEGRKYLVFFSEGFEDYLFDGQGSSTFVRRLQQTFEEFRRAGWTIQSVDAGGVRGFDDQFNTTDSLALLAKETGGDFYQNVNHLGDAMESLLAKTGVTYLLAFQSPEIALDGSYHPIEVRLKDAPRGARVRHRSGYFAPDPDAEPRDIERVFAAGEKILDGVEGGELEIAALATPFKGAPGEGADLAVWIEVDGESLPEPTAESLEMEAFVYAFDADGEIRDFFTQRVALDPVKIGETLARGGDLRFYGDLHLAAGDYELRVLVRAGRNGRYGLRRIPATVADFSGSAPVLSGAVFFDDPERPSIVVREAGSGSHPFRIGSGSYYPAVRPALAADSPARISLMAYRLEPDLRVRATIVDAHDAPLEPDRLAVAGKDRHGGLDQIFFDFRPAGLAPGDYTLRLELTDPATGASYARSATFQLVAR